MPIYEYRCEKGHTFEVMQSMTADPVQACEVCGAPVQRVFHPVAVHFKGKGFYNTDYGTRRRNQEKAASKSSDSSTSSSGSGSSSASSSSDGGSSSKPSGDAKPSSKAKKPVKKP